MKVITIHSQNIIAQNNSEELVKKIIVEENEVIPTFDDEERTPHRENDDSFRATREWVKRWNEA